MFNSLLFILPILLATLILLVGQTRWPKSKTMTALREWQTFLAGVIGLIAIVLSIAIPDQMLAKKERTQAVITEVAYLKNLEFSLRLFEKNLRSDLGVIQSAQEYEQLPTACAKLLEMLPGSQRRYISIEESSAVTLNALPPQSFSLLQTANSLQQNFMWWRNAFKVEDCVLRADSTVDILESSYDEFIDQTAELRLLISNRLAVLNS